MSYCISAPSAVGARERGHGQTNTMKLNGIAISRVEKEILQNIYWLRLLSATWSLMQIDQPFSLLVPNEFPDLPSLDETTSTILQLDRASGNISALHSQTQNICWMWPLSYVTITVAQIYILHLNAPSEARKDQIPPSSFLLRSDLDQSTVASGIRDYFLQAIHFVEHEATTLSSQSFLLTAYHTVLIYMLFSSSEEQSPPPTASPTVHALCKSIMTLLVISERLSQPIGPMSAHRTYSAHTLVLALDVCSRALVHICMKCEQEYIADLDTTRLIRDRLVGLVEKLREACKTNAMPQYAFAMRLIKKTAQTRAFSPPVSCRFVDDKPY